MSVYYCLMIYPRGESYHLQVKKYRSLRFLSPFTVIKDRIFNPFIHSFCNDENYASHWIEYKNTIPNL